MGVQHLSGYEQYFAMARGVEGTVALDMSKFFDTNYHYMVPELDNASKPTADWSKLLEKARLSPFCLWDISQAVQAETRRVNTSVLETGKKEGLSQIRWLSPPDACR